MASSLGHPAPEDSHYPWTSFRGSRQGYFDSNATKAFNYVGDLSVEGEMVGLRLTGRELARLFLDEVLDPNIPQTFVLTANRRSKTSRPGDTEADTPAKQGRSRQSGEPKNVAKLVAAWKSLDAPLDGHAILQDRALVDKGLFGLWAVRKAVGEEGMTVSRRDLAGFIGKAFEQKVSDRALENALKKAKDKALNSEGTKFHINGTGVRHIEGWTTADGTTIGVAMSKKNRNR